MSVNFVRQPIPRKWVVFLGFFSILTLLGGYSYLSQRQHEQNAQDTTIPTWGQLWDGIDSAISVDPRSGERWILEDSAATAERFFLGIFWGSLVGVLLGLFMGSFSPIAAFFVPPLTLLAKVPPTAALAVFFVLVGTDLSMYIAMIAFGILPILALSIHMTVQEFPEELLNKSYTLGASNMEIVWTILFRHILPKVIDAIRLQIGPALVYLIAAEMVVGDVGFGYRIRLQSRLLNMNVVYPYLGVLAGFGFLMDSLLLHLQEFLCPWYSSARKDP